MTPEIGHVYLGDCIEVMKGFPDEFFSAVVTDPPYDLTSGKKGGTGEKSMTLANPYGRARAGGFMGREWDATGIAFRVETWAALLRVAKPGAHLLAFGGTRTEHRMTVAIEDAGWEIRDKLVWAYAQGFPKSDNVGRRIDMRLCREPGRHVMSKMPVEARRKPGDHLCPTTEQGDLHRHEGTALKPAWEPIVLARKPYRGTIADVILEHGTGALNIDGTRIPVDPADPVNEAVWTSRPSAFRDGTQGFVTSMEDGDRQPARPKPRDPRVVVYGDGLNGTGPMRKPAADPVAFNPGLGVARLDAPAGRWPANVILTDPIFDGGVQGVVGGGDAPSGGGDKGGRAGTAGWFGLDTAQGFNHDYVGDAGTYSRFFLIGKADRDQREPLIPGSIPTDQRGVLNRNSDSHAEAIGNLPKAARENTHPTVKPLMLMRHLVRLVTPAGGTVLDPFMGSGTTAMAAEIEGFAWVGIEMMPEHVEITKARLIQIERGLGLDVEAPRVKRTTSEARPWPKKREPGVMGSAAGVLGNANERLWQEDES